MSRRPSLVLAAAALALAACRSSRVDPPRVQGSSTRPRDTDVRVTGSLEFAPACVAVRAGQTVEWWVDPAVSGTPVNVTSIGRPVELFSPSLVKPLACDPAAPDRVCWRHTFEGAGCFDYYDTNSGDPGRPVVDDYYGTVTYVGEAKNVSRGTVCVAGPSVSCDGVCCTSKFDCADGYVCQRSRCVRASDAQPSPCPARPADNPDLK